ncbi:MAG: aldehyde dehydrogenase family protein [Rhizobiaceae bacterium]|nr:aldehyde dehydrogenase family protein [Rhizobiaceae bacterium]
MDELAKEYLANLVRFMGPAGKILINGSWIAAGSEEPIDVHNPATGKVIAHIAAGGKAEVDLAVKAARAAFDEGPWTRITPTERSRLIWRLSDLIEANSEEFALLETLDNGKPLGAARADVATAVGHLRYNAGWPTKLTGDTIAPSSENALLMYTLREPVGVAGLIAPWNFPLVNAILKLAPALAAGCTVVLKPAEQTSLTTLRLGMLICEAGIPDGVVNIVTGYGREAGAALTEHPGVDKISFTGSTQVGRNILRAAAGDFKRVSLELGGKSPVIIFPDADLEQAIEGAAARIFGNAGQVCTANSRLYTHRDVFDRVVEGVSERAEKIKVGPGFDAGSQMGPVISREQRDRILGHIEAGVSEGATLTTGGRGIGSEGYFIEPTVFVQTKPDMSVMREEIFGPVLCAASFSEDDLDSIAREANDTVYGLSAAIWTRDLTTAHLLSRKLRAGSIRINGAGNDFALPFGGYKQSGFGRENGREGVEAFTELKSVSIGH